MLNSHTHKLTYTHTHNNKHYFSRHCRHRENHFVIDNLLRWNLNHVKPFADTHIYIHIYIYIFVILSALMDLFICTCPDTLFVYERVRTGVYTQIRCYVYAQVLSRGDVYENLSFRPGTRHLHLKNVKL